jgi:hypothetical protein
LILLLLGWVVAGLIPGAWAPAGERARRTRCASNLKQTGYGCHLYASEYGEEFPPGLGHLYPDFISDGRVFTCPTARRATVVEDDPGFTRNDYKPAFFADTHADFVYVSGLKESDPKDYVVAFDDEWNHPDKWQRGRRYKHGVNVLHLGSNVEWTHDINALHGQLAKQEKELAAQGRKMELLRPAWSTWPEPPAELSGRPLRLRDRIAVAVGMMVAIVVALALVVRTVRRGRKTGGAGNAG